jgi:hypothetical protein
MNVMAFAVADITAAGTGWDSPPNPPDRVE